MCTGKEKSKVEKIEGWITTDARAFLKKKDAFIHQRKLDFEEWYDISCHKLVTDSSVSARELSNWLYENRDEVIKLLCVDSEQLIEEVK